LSFSLLLLTAAVPPGALAAADGGDSTFHTGRGQLLVTVDGPAVKNGATSPAVVPNDPKQVLQDYDSLMIVLTKKFSAHSRRLPKLPSVAT
jgi:hypothetical protein